MVMRSMIDQEPWLQPARQMREASTPGSCDRPQTAASTSPARSRPQKMAPEQTKAAP